MADGFDLQGMMQAAQRMQQELMRAQEGLTHVKVDASSGGGMVTVVVNGKMEVLEVRIDPACVDPKDVGMLQDLVLAATNQALVKAKAAAEQALAKVTGGMNIPGMPGMF
jgi:DNA-binding YbaB/EbfC family protein